MNKAAAASQINSEAKPLLLDTCFRYLSLSFSPQSQINNLESNGSTKYADVALSDISHSISSTTPTQNDVDVNIRVPEDYDDQSLPPIERHPPVSTRRASNQRLKQYSAPNIEDARIVHCFKSHEYYFRNRVTSNADLTYNYCLTEIENEDLDFEDEDDDHREFISLLHATQKMIKLSSENIDSNLAPSEEVYIKNSTFGDNPPFYSDYVKYNQLVTPTLRQLPALGNLTETDGRIISDRSLIQPSLKEFMRDVASNYAVALQLASSRNSLIYSYDTLGVYEILKFRIVDLAGHNKIYFSNRGFKMEEFFRYLGNYDFSSDKNIKILEKSVYQLAKRLLIDGGILFTAIMLCAVYPYVGLQGNCLHHITVARFIDKFEHEAVSDNFKFGLNRFVKFFVINFDDYGRLLSMKIEDLFSHFGFFYIGRHHLFRLISYLDYILYEN